MTHRISIVLAAAWFAMGSAASASFVDYRLSSGQDAEAETDVQGLWSRTVQLISAGAEWTFAIVGVTDSVDAGAKTEKNSEACPEAKAAAGASNGRILEPESNAAEEEANGASIRLFFF